MMRKLFTFLCLFLPTLIAIGQSSIQRPKLVVGIVVDQMRQEFLYRYYDKLGEDGFKKLMNEGFMLKNVHYNYVPTYTGPGHASIYTGTTPNVHGIIANDWYHQNLKRQINCVEDTSVSCVGGDPSFGAFSPANLLSTTITDELRIFTQNRSKVISASIKNRGAILPGGHNPNGAYWYDEVTTNFVTSTWYSDTLPKWVADFNSQEKVKKYMKGKWETLLPIDQYTESTSDNTDYELIWKGRKKPTFPYNLKKLQKDNEFYEIFNHVPFGNDLLKDFAIEAISHEQLGQDNATDFLAISFSATDRIGHKYGPYSVEMEDTYLRLDQNIAELLRFLESKVGKGNYTVFLTADHGVADVARHMNDQKQPNWYLMKSSLKTLNMALVEKYGEGEWVRDMLNYQVFLNNELIRAKGINRAELLSFLSEQLMQIKGIANVFLPSDLSNRDIAHDEISMLSNGFYPSRSGDILFSFEPGWVYESSYYYKYGSAHGTNYTYDTHVPLIFYGWGIESGSSVKYHPITDIAPTLSMLLNIKLPSGATGDPIVEIFQQED